jgi:cytochrome c oxidase subunit 2
VDLIPGRNNEMWMMPDELITDKDGKVIQEGADTYENGLYYGQCAQYCGESHAFMLFRARVVSDKDFVQWVNQSLAKVGAPAAGGNWGKFLSAINPDDEDTKPDQTMLATPEQRGAALFFGRGSCIQCHKIDGSPSTATLGPNLTRVASRTSLASGFLDNLGSDGKIDPTRQRENFYHWISHSYDYKPGNLMWYPQPGTNAGGLRDIVLKNKNSKTPITDQDWHDLAAFLMTLK